MRSSGMNRQVDDRPLTPRDPLAEGVRCENAGLFDRALEYFDIAARDPDPGVVAEALWRSAHVHRRLCAWDAALDAAERSATVAQGAGLSLRYGEALNALAAVHPGARVLGAADSRVASVSAALATADLAHLACHGVPRADNPMFSSLVLADGAVTVQELHRAGVAPRRLVLASCHSGADVAYAGDEVLGFVSAMLARGTAGVVANIAAVPDVEVVDLMVGLHRGLAAGQTMARALHAARGGIDTRTPAGFVNWCTFSAHGAA